MDGVDDGVQHIGIGGEALLEILRQRVSVGELHRLDLLILRRGRNGLAIGHDGRHDGRVLHLIALDVLHQLLPQLLRGLIAVLRLEGAGFEKNGGQLIVGVERRGQLFAGDAAAVSRLCRRFFVLKRRVVAVKDAVEDETDGVNIRGRLDAAHEIEQLRRGVGAEHMLRHGAVFQLVDLGDAEVAQHEMPLLIEVDI